MNLSDLQNKTKNLPLKNFRTNNGTLDFEQTKICCKIYCFEMTGI